MVDLDRLIDLGEPDLPCGQCGHLRSTHFQERGSCMHSTAEVVWACGCDYWYPERDPAWADIYARIKPSRDGYIVEFRIDSQRSFFHIVPAVDVERTYLGWTGILDAFVRAADHLIRSTQGS